MKTKYLCADCGECYDSEDIAYQYVINVGGKYPVKEFICKDCEKEGKRKRW